MGWGRVALPDVPCDRNAPGSGLRGGVRTVGAIDFGKLFSFDGRIGRKTFWMLGLYTFLANLVIYVPLFLVGDNGGLQLVLLLVSLAFYAAMAFQGLATTVKRLHDRNKSGWFYLVSLIPLVGPIWLLIEVGFREGVPGANIYGEPNSGSPFRDELPVAAYGD